MMNIRHVTMKCIAVFMLSLGVASIILTAGCGSEITAPQKSTITLNPPSQSFTVAGGVTGVDLPFDYMVIVTYPDGTPMPKAKITISGALAVPNPSGAYQFYYTQYYVGNPNTVDSPFTAQTDDFGQYTFSALVSAGTPTFSDIIVVRSGANVGTATIAIK